MNMDKYPYFFLVEYGRLCSTGQHWPGFPRVLYDALLCLGYDWDVPIYRCSLSMANGLDICKASATIPLNQEDLWMGTVIDSEPDTTIEQTTHVTLTSLCEKQRLGAVSDLEDPHFSVGMAAMVLYVQYLFNLQHNTIRIVIQQCMHLTAYDEHNTCISRKLEQLKQENALLYSGTLPPLDQERELKVAYCYLSEVEHAWNYTR
jgi:hypothetical protein